MKRGITAASVSIMIVIIIILLGTVTISSYNSIQNAKKITFSLEISSIQEEVNRYIRLNNASEDYPILTKVYTLSLENVSEDIILTQFEGETINSNKEVTLYELDLEAINITNTEYGKLETEKDVYVLSKETGKVYYLSGVRANKTIYYTLTNDLLDLNSRNKKKSNESSGTTKPSIKTDGFISKIKSNGEIDSYISNIKIEGENIKVAKYEFGIIEHNVASEYFKTNGKTIMGDRINLNDYTNITLYVEDENSNNVVKYVYAIVPKGFVASEATGENTIEYGLVIYEGVEPVTDENVLEAQKTRNQYVWVPVPDIKEFIRRDGYYEEEKSTIVSTGVATEPYSYDTLITQANDLTGEHSEYSKMKSSVEKYGGFYIARYEASTSTDRVNKANGTSTDVLSQKDKWVYNYVGWGPSMTTTSGNVIYENNDQGKGAVELSRSIYPENGNKSVVSTLCYGVQWDAALQYISTRGVKDTDYIKNGKGKGNYNGNLYKTGFAERNNIYDMAGNVEEWTMEAGGNKGRISRGGTFHYDINASIRYPASYRSNHYPNTADDYTGFRVALYLK